MNSTAKPKHINYVFKRQQNSAPSQGKVAETVFTFLPETTKRKGKKKMDEIYETLVVKSLDIRQQRTVILVVKETNDCPSLLL